MADPSGAKSDRKGLILVSVIVALLVLAAVFWAVRRRNPSTPRKHAVASAAADPYPTFDPKSGTVVTSDDGLAKIEIPDGALPDGVSASDITVTRVDDKLVSTRKDAPDVDHHYRLGPDGTVFKKPVVLQMTVPEKDMQANGAAVPVVQLSSGADGKMELPAYQTVDVDGKTGNVDVTVDVPHFSGVGYDFVFGSKIDPWPTKPWYVGQNFTMKFTVFNLKSYPPEWKVSYGLYHSALVDGSSYTVHGNGAQIELADMGYITPYDMNLHTETLKKDQIYTEVQTKTCVHKGWTFPLLQPSLIIDAKVKDVELAKGFMQTANHRPLYKTKIEDYHVKIDGYRSVSYECDPVPTFHKVTLPTLCDPTGKNPNLPACK